MDETMATFADYAKHPDCRPGLKQLVDLRPVIEIQYDFPKMMQMQATKADVFMGGPAETLIVYLADKPDTKALAQLVLRSWEPFPAVVPMVIEEEAEALAVLGLRENSIAEVLSPTV